MVKPLIKNFIYRPLRPLALMGERLYQKSRCFNVPLSKLLRGGENGIRAAKYAELTNNFLRPSTSVFEGPHVKLLQLYDEIGDRILDKKVFEQTDYYKNALECMNLTGAYFYDRPEKIITLAERFIRQYRGEKLNLPPQPGQSDSNQPIWVRPIKYSSCYEIIDGNHRIAHAIMKGEQTIKALVYEKEPVFTPLQQLLLDVLWINKRRWLYQPVEAPELKDSWNLIRKCSDRFAMMEDFLKSHQLLPNSTPKATYLDIGSSYGWFVKQMSKLGFNAFGLERDPVGADVGFKVYGLDPKQILQSDIVLHLERERKKYDIVSCLSVLHHFALGKSSTTAEDFIKLVDKITGKVLFLDTGESHEKAFGNSLDEWDVEFIMAWLQKHTSFSKIIPLGVDDDRVAPFEGYYRRTLFACVK